MRRAAFFPLFCLLIGWQAPADAYFDAFDAEPDASLDASQDASNDANADAQLDAAAEVEADTSPAVPDSSHEAEKAAALEEERLANEARKKALAEAKGAKDERFRALANERARAEGIREQQATFRSKLADRRKLLADTARDEGARVDDLTGRARSVPFGSDAADRLFDEIVLLLDLERDRLGHALDAYVTPDAIPKYEVDPTVVAGLDPALAPQRDQLVATSRALSAEAMSLARDARKLELDAIDAAFAREHALNTARLQLIERLTPSRRDTVLGFGPDGLRALKREVLHLKLMARWIAVARHDTQARWIASARQTPVLWAALWRVIAGAIVVLVARRVIRSAPEWLKQTRVWAAKSFRRVVVVRGLERAIDVLEAMLPETVVLATVLAAPRVLALAGDGPVAVVVRIALAWSIYRFVLRALHLAIGWAVSSPIAKLSEAVSAKILRSLRLIGRFWLVLVVFATIAEAALGRGYLYHLAVRLAWMGTIPIFALLVRWWRDDIADAYLKRRTTGGLSELVRRTRGHWYGFFVAVVAVVFVIAALVGRAARRFVLGFEQSRKALAYLFRRRLEKHADLVETVPDPRALPEEVRHAFDQSPIDGQSWVTDRFPGLDRFSAAFERWRDGDPAEAIGTFLVTGRAGFGKTSWLSAAIARAARVEVTRIELTRRCDTPDELFAVLADALGIARAEAKDADALAAAIRKGSRRIVAIDDAHLLFRRGVGGLVVWAAFNELIERVAGRVYWVATMGHYAHEYLSWARRGNDAFHTVQPLPPWTESDVTDLLRARMAASGFEAVYDDLVIEKLEGVEAEAQLVSTEREYMRLIWDYAEGSPRAALHFWIHSLAPGDGRTLRVRLFPRPDAKTLDDLRETERFGLASVIWHGSLDLDEATRALNYDRFVCEAALRRLRDLEVLVEHEGSFSLSIAWWPATLRYLRRKHLIAT